MKNFSLNQIIESSLKLKMLMYFSVVIAIFLIGYVCLLKNIFLELNAEKKQQIVLLAKVTQQQQQLKNKERETSQLLELINSQSKEKTLMISVGLTTILTDLMVANQKQQLITESLQPKAIVREKRFVIYPVHLIAKGNYQQFKNWLFELAHLPYPIVAQKILMDGNQVNANLEIYQFIK